LVTDTAADSDRLVQETSENALTAGFHHQPEPGTQERPHAERLRPDRLERTERHERTDRHERHERTERAERVDLRQELANRVHHDPELAAKRLQRWLATRS
ncbi:MAG: hypothetical protein ACKOBW_11690, partial [Planctomycetota bacterium]